MTSQEPEIKQYEKRLSGEAVVVGEYSIQPIAQVTGRYLSVSGETGEGAGALLQIKPLEVIVKAEEAEAYAVSITDETGEALKGIAQGGLLVAALCWVVILVVSISRFFKEKAK